MLFFFLQIDKRHGALVTWSVHSLIHLLYPLKPEDRVKGSAAAYQCSYLVKVDWCPGWIASSLQGHKKAKNLALTFTPRDDLYFPISLTCIFMNCGRKQEKTHADTWEHTNSTQKGPRPRNENLPALRRQHETGHLLKTPSSHHQTWSKMFDVFFYFARKLSWKKQSLVD